MNGVTLFYNAKCPDCVRQAHRTRKLDWFKRVELSTNASPIGKVPVGEIVVVRNPSGQVYTGAYATRMLCLQVPAYFVFGLALYVAPIRKMFGKDKVGCNGDACDI